MQRRTPSLPGHRTALLAASLLAGAAMTCGSTAWAQEAVGGGASGSTGAATGPSSGTASGTAAGTAPGVSTGAATAFVPSAGAGIAPGIGYGSSILPATGFGGGLENLRDFVNSPLTQPASHLFTFDNSVQVQAGYDDNVGGAATNQRPQGSAELRITPSFNVSGEGRTTQVNLNYQPTIYYYPSVERQSRIDQSLNARSHTELVSQTAFLDLTAFAGQTSNNNVNGQNSSTVVSRQDRTQFYSFAANPYLVHQFGGTGTARLDYSFADTITQGTNAYGSSTGTTNSAFNAFGASGNSRTITQTEGASFTTGEDFGRFNHTAALLATQYSGQGSLRSGHRNTATYDLAYAYSRSLTLTGRIGYEDLYYSGTSSNGVITSLPYKLTAPLGSAGFKYVPNPDSSIAMSYGYVDGGGTFTLDASYKPTARTVIYATSSSGVTTNAQQIQGFAQGTQVSQSGVTIDPRTGAPVQYSNNNLSNANQVYRLTQTSVTGALIYDRDSFSASILHSDQSSVSGGTLGSNSGSSTSGSLGWQHTVSDTVSASVNGQYGIYTTHSTGTANQSNPTLSASAQLTKIFTEKLSGTANYNYYSFSNGAGSSGVGSSSTNTSQHVTVNEILFGLLQHF